MLKNCWNKLSKRTDDWGEIRMTIEDHLTLHPNWNLHPSNPNPDLTGLKDAYRYGEENYLDKTGQVRMEVNVVKAPVRNAPVQLPALLRPGYQYSIRIVRTHSMPWGIVTRVTNLDM